MVIWEWDAYSNNFDVEKKQKTRRERAAGRREEKEDSAGRGGHVRIFIISTVHNSKERAHG